MVNLNRIRGSDGNGESVKAVVTGNRLANATTITVDSVQNWQGDFIGTYGTLDGDNSLIPASVRVFFGHLSGSDIEIDSFAPGYTDNGNSVGDVVLLKPTTAWADELAEFLAVSHKDDGALAQVTRSEPGIKLAVAPTQPSPDPDGNIILWFEPL